jgi:hypothetical protein
VFTARSWRPKRSGALWPTIYIGKTNPGKKTIEKHKKEVNLKKRSIWTVALFLGVFLAASVSGSAQWRRFGPLSDRGLGLTDEQLAKIQDIRLAFQEKIGPLRLEWQKAQVKLDSLEMKGAGQKELDSAYEELDRMEADLKKAYQDHRSDVHHLLTEEQRAVFDRFGGFGMGRGMNPMWGMRPGLGRGLGPGRGMGIRLGYGFGWDLGMGRGFGRSWGRGPGRGYFCPWFRWR